jgi:hypothetical protein
MRTVLLLVLVAGCSSGGGGGGNETCSMTITCGAKGSYKFCTASAGNACRYLATDGTSFPCATCASCQSAAANAASWCSGGGNSDGGPRDMAGGGGGDLALESACGHPGDPGNNLGVGKFCRTNADCTQDAPICTAILNGNTPSPSDTYYCTVPCTQGQTDCGTGASCLCSGNGCGCTPDSCG